MTIFTKMAIGDGRTGGPTNIAGHKLGDVIPAKKMHLSFH